MSTTQGNLFQNKSQILRDNMDKLEGPRWNFWWKKQSKSPKQQLSPPTRLVYQDGSIQFVQITSNTTVIRSDDGKKVYDKEKKLGEGTYGNVYLCKDCNKEKNQNDQEKVVIKQLKQFDAPNENGFEPTTIREVSLLKHLNKNKYIVQLLDVFITKKGDFCIVFEHCKQDLYHYIQQNKTTGGISIHQIKVN